MTDQPDFRALFDAQKQQIQALHDQITSLRQSEAELKASLTTYIDEAKSQDQKLLEPFLSRIAEIKAQHKEVLDSQKELRQSMDSELTKFRQEIRGKLAAIRRTVSSNLKATLPPQSPVDVPPQRAQPVTPAAAPPTPPSPSPSPSPVVASDGPIAIQAAPTDPLNGLLAALHRKIADDPVAKGEVIVTASASLDAGRLGPQNAADPTSDANFVSKNQPNSWIRYDFKNRKVTLTHYSIRSRTDGFKGSNNLKEWIVKVSNDGEDWVEVDRRTNSEELNGKAAIGTFQLASEAPASRFVQLEQSGPAHSGKHFLALSAFELFGSLNG